MYRVGDEVRITIQAINAGTDAHIWAETYEREIRNVLALQNDVVRAIAEEIRVTLTPEEESYLTRARPVDPETYDLYLKGMFELNKFTARGRTRGLAYLEEAVATDPDEPLAHAGLALVYSLIASHSDSPPPDAWDRAKNAAYKALELDPGLAEAHAAIAEIKLYRDWDWDGARKAFARAVRLNSSLAGTHAHYAWCLSLYGDMNAAVAEMRQAQLVDPLNALWIAWLGEIYEFGGDLDSALAEVERGVELNPDHAWLWLTLGRVYGDMGRYDEAIEAHQQAVERNPGWKYELGRSYAIAGRMEEARAIQAELESQDRPASAWGMAMLYGALGEKEKGIRALQTMYEEGHPWTPWITGSQFEPLHDDPRYVETLQKLDLPGS